MARRVVDEEPDTVVVERERGADDGARSLGTVIALILLVLLVLALLWWRPWGGGDDNTNIDINTPNTTPTPGLQE